MAVNRAKLERLIFIREIQASFIGVGLLLVVLFLLAIALTPRSITVRLSAAEFEQGSRRVVIHALDNVDLTKTLLTEETDATVSDGHLQIQWVVPAELRDRPFIIEVCTTKNGANGTEVCAKPEVGRQESHKLAVKGVATDGALYSCPYYVSEPKTSLVASLLGMNDVELDSRVYCGTSNEASDEFTSESRAAQIGQLTMNGMIPSGSGILTVKDGQLSLLDPASLNASTTATPQTTIVQQYYPTTLVQQIASSDAAQTLVLTNRTLSISNGNSVLIPETVIPAAGSFTDGLLSSADWNAFSSKENSLTLDSSLTRTGDTIGLMGCAVGEILKNNGSTWVCANDIGASSGAYTAGTGIAIDFANNIHNTGVLSVSASGALTATAGQSPAITLQTTSSFSQLAGQLALSATGVTSGNYNNVTVNTEGRVTSATNVAYLTTEQDGIVGNEVSDVVVGGGLVLSGGGTAANPYKVGLITTCSSGQLLKWNGSAWACAADDNTTNTDNQTLSYNPTTSILTIAGGNTVDLSALKDNTDNQSIVRTGNVISISGSAGIVDLTPYLDNTDSQTLTVSGTGVSRTMTISGGNTVGIGDSDNQTLSIAGNVISLTNGGSVTLPTDQNTTYSNGNGMSLTGTTFAINAPTCTGTTAKLLWSGTAFTCGTDIDTDTNTTYGAGSGLTLSGTTFALAQQGASPGQVLKWNGTAWAPANDVDTDMQSITYDTSTRVVSLTNGGSFTIPLATGTTTGLLSAGDWANFNNKESVLTFGDGLLRTSNSVGLMDCAAGQILQRNGTDTAWLCANQVVDTDTNTTYSAGTGISINGSNQISATLGTTIDGTEIIDGTITAVDLATIAGLTPGTYNNVTVNAQGQVVGGTNVNYLTSYTETDGIIGNEVAGVVASGGLVMTGSGTSVSPYKLGLVTTCSDGQLLKYTTAGGWTCADDVDTDTNTDAQSLSWNATNNILSISGGNTVDLTSLRDNTDAQAISLSGDTLSISGNVATVDLSKYTDNTDEQTLTWDGGARTISISGGNTITLPADQNTTYSSGDGISLTGTVFAINAPTCSLSQKLIWTGTAFSCENDIDTDTDTDTNTTYSAGDGLILNGTTFALDPQGASTGQVLAWDGTKWAPYSPSAFSDTDDQTLSYNSTTRELTIDGGNTVTFPLASSTATGLLSASDWNAFNGKENILTFSDGIVRSSNTVTLMDCAANQILQRNGTDTAWLCANQVVDTDTNTTYTAGTGLALTGTEFSSTGVLSVTSSGALTTTTGQNPALTLTTTSDFSQVANQLALSTTGVTAGTYNGLTVDARGRVTNATQMNYLTSEDDGVVGNEVAGIITGGGLVMTGAGTSVDPYKVGMISTCSSGQLLKWIGGQWVCANDADTDTDAQTLTFNGTTGDLSLTNGGTVNLNSLNTDNQTLSLAGNTLSLTSGGSVNLTPYLDNTDSQTLSLAGNTISLTNGGSITLPTDQNTTYTNGNGLSLTGTVFAINAPTCSGTDKLQWNGSAFVCTTDVDTNTDTQTLTWDNGTRTLSISGGNNVTIPDTNTDAQTLSYDAATRTVSLTNGGSFTLPLSSGTTTGLLSAADWTTFNGKENILAFSDGLARTSNSVTLMDCAASQILQRNTGDTAWVCANQVVDTDTNTTYTAGTGLSLTGTTFANTGTLSVTASGALTSSGGQNPALSLTTTSDLTQLAGQLGLSGTGVTPGTYNNVTVDDKGRVTAGTNVSYLTSYTETDGIVGNEIANVTNNGGLVMTGAGTTGDPYKVGMVTTCSDGQLLKYTTTGGWACASDVDTDTNTDQQTLSWDNTTNVLSLANGGTVDLSVLKDNTDNQTLSIAGNIISLTNGGSVTLPADQDTTYTSGNGISLTGTVFAISAPTCTGATAKLLWSGTAFTCGTDVDTDTNTTYDAGSGLSLTGTTFALAQQGASTGQVLAWNGNAWAPLTPSAFSDTDDQTLSYNASTRELSIDGGNTITFPLASATGSGLLSSADWTTFSGKENILTFSDGLLRSSNTVTLMDCAADQVLQRNSGDTAWVCANQVVDTDTNTTYTAGTGLSLTGNTFANTGTLSVSASGALTSSGGQNPAITLATTSDLTQVGGQLGLSTTGVTAGTYNNVTVDAQGRVTTGTNLSYLTSEQDAVIGNEVAGVVANGGLVMTGAGTTLSPYRVGLVTTCSDGQLLKYTAAGGWACATDIDTNTDAQTLSYNATTNILTLANGGTVDLSDLQDNTDSQTLSVTSPSAGSHTIAISGGNSQGLIETQDLAWNSTTRALSITGGTTVTIADANTTYSAGAGLDLTGTTFSLAQQGASSGQVLKWNGTTWAPAADIDTDTNTTYSAGSGLALTGTTFSLGSCSAGQIYKYNGTAWACSADVDTNTDAQTLSYNSTTRELAISGGNIISFPLASATGAGLLSSTDWSTFNSKENILTFSDGLARTSNNVTLMDCAASQILQRNAGDTAWVCANQVTDTNTTYTAGTGLSLTGTTFANTGVLSVTASGALTSSGGQNPAITLTTTSDLTQLSNQLGLSNTGVTAGTYNNVTVDAKGRVTAATNVSYLTSEQDAVIGNEVAGVIASGGLVMTGGGTALSPYKVGLVTTCADGQLLKYTALGGWACANDTDTDTNTDAQTLSWNGATNILTISGGNTVDLTSLKDNTDNQTLSIAGNVISLTNGGSVTLPADQNTTYTAGNGISLTGTVFAVNAPTCSGTTKLQWNGTAFVCSTDIDTNTDAQTLSYNASTRELSISGGNLVTFPLASGTTTGLLSSTDWSTFNGKENALTFTGNGLFSRSGNIVTGSTCTTTGEIMKWNGTAWACATDNAGGVTDGDKGDITVSGSGVSWNIDPDSVALGTDTTGNYVAGATSGNGITVSGTAGEGWSPTIAINAPTCTAGQYLTWNGSAFSCNTPTDTNTTNFNISANGAGSQNIAAGNTVNFQNGTGTTATVDASKNVSFNLTNVGTAGTYGSATTVPVITTDAQGRITGVTNTAISFPAEVDGVIGNEVTNATTNGGLIRAGSGTAGSPYTLGLITTCTDQQVLKYTVGTTSWGCAADNDTTYSAGTGITITSGVIAAALGTDITSSEIVDGTIAAADLAASGATAGTYGDSGVNVAQLTVNAQGQVTAVSNRALPTASATTTGILTSTDWSTFNGKENVLTFTGNGLYSRVGNTVTGLACTTTGQTPTWNGTTFACGTQIISLNGLNGALTLQTGTAGADFNISASGNTITLNIPDASATARGLVTTGTQTFAGDKTLTGSTTLGDANTDVATVNGTLLNNGATSYGVLSIANVAAGGAIGTAATTVDIKTAFNINQTTAGQAITLPTPTDTAAGRIAYVQNIGSASFSFYGTSVLPNQSRQAIWNGTAWVLTGNADDPKGSIVLRKSADEAVNNSIAPQNDDHLFWTVGANETWIFEVSGTVRSGATANLRLRMALPGTPTSCSNSASASYNGSATSNAACNTDIILTNINNQAATDNSDQFTYYGTFKTGASGGTAQMMFAQGTATNIRNVTGVNMTAGGSGYTSAPTVGFTGGTCSVAPVGTATIYNGQVVSVNVTTAGTCTAAPTTVTFTGGGGTGATASIVRGITLARDTTLNAFRVSGADVAEFYYSKDATVVPADIVALDGSGPSQVMKASLASRDKTVGIVSTKPGQVLGEIDGTGKPVIIGLAGRVPVKVKGKVVAGDMITVSDEPGVGMAAKTSGRVVGKALTGFAGDGVGQVMMLIDNTYWQAPVNFDLSSIISTGGVNVITVPQTTDSQLADIGIKPVDTTSYSGFDQAIVDQIMNAFKTQQSQIDELKAAVSALKQPVGTTQGATLQAAVWSGGIVTNDTTFNGLVTFNSHVIFSGDNAGSVTIPAGQTTASIILKSSMTKAPKVVATPGGFTVGQYRVTGQTTSGFIIELQQPQTTDMTFDWHAFESTNP